MKKKEKDYAYEEIEKAKKVIRRFGNIPMREMEYMDQIELVKMYYPEIRGEPLDKISKRQLYRIAERLYHDAHKISEKYTPFERIILGEVSQLKSTQDPETRFALEERIAIQIEGCKNNFLQKALERAINE